MNTSDNAMNCRSKCWTVAAALGLLFAVLLFALGDYRFLSAFLLGLLAFVVLGFALPMLLCKGVAPMSGAGQGATSHPKATDPTAPGIPVTAAGATPVAGTAAIAVATPEVASSPDQTACAPAPKRPVADPAPAPDHDKDAVQEGSGEGARPATLSAPRGGKADDLKQIKGIGPKLEKMCNEMGFYHFDQIANWSADEVAWVNANLTGFKGRVTRDDWVKQAAILASGQETEFSRRVEDGDVY